MKEKLIQKFNELADEFIRKTKYRSPFIKTMRPALESLHLPDLEKAVEVMEEMNKTYSIENTREMVKKFEDGYPHCEFVDGAWEIR